MLVNHIFHVQLGVPATGQHFGPFVLLLFQLMTKTEEERGPQNTAFSVVSEKKQRLRLIPRT